MCNKLLKYYKIVEANMESSRKNNEAVDHVIDLIDTIISSQRSPIYNNKSQITQTTTTKNIMRTEVYKGVGILNSDQTLDQKYFIPSTVDDTKNIAPKNYLITEDKPIIMHNNTEIYSEDIILPVGLLGEKQILPKNLLFDNTSTTAIELTKNILVPDKQNKKDESLQYPIKQTADNLVKKNNNDPSEKTSVSKMEFIESYGDSSDQQSDEDIMNEFRKKYNDKNKIQKINAHSKKHKHSHKKCKYNSKRHGSKKCRNHGKYKNNRKKHHKSSNMHIPSKLKYNKYHLSYDTETISDLLKHTQDIHKKNEMDDITRKIMMDAQKIIKNNEIECFTKNNKKHSNKNDGTTLASIINYSVDFIDFLNKMFYKITHAITSQANQNESS